MSVFFLWESPLSVETYRKKSGLCDCAGHFSHQPANNLTLRGVLSLVNVLLSLTDRFIGLTWRVCFETPTRRHSLEAHLNGGIYEPRQKRDFLNKNS